MEHDALDGTYFFGIEWGVVLAIDIVEPERWLLQLWQRFIPRKDGIGLATDKAPVDSCNVVLL